MNPQDWPDLVYTYGPYALLPLLLLWVAPRQTKQFLQCRRDDSAQQGLCALVAVICWISAFYLVGVIVSRWPPKTVYEGSLGIHSYPAKFFSASTGFFVHQTAMPGAVERRSRWAYTVVSEEPRTEDFMFTFQWGPGESDYSDLYMPPALLKAGRLDLSRDDQNPGGLLYDDDNDPDTPGIPFRTAAVPPSRPAIGSVDFAIGTAHADIVVAVERINESLLIEWLNSPDSYWRAQGRGQLRNFTKEELARLLARDDLPDRARRQINEELTRRR
ncbi:MAG: hypothetical protein OEN55_03740 [Alphaproteobacteria bacterium]|nr:hypothetical protein [Alphaproteobacteria bacterium]